MNAEIALSVNQYRYSGALVVVYKSVRVWTGIHVKPQEISLLSEAHTTMEIMFR